MKKNFHRKILNSTSFIVGYSNNTTWTTIKVFSILTVINKPGLVEIQYYESKDYKHANGLKTSILELFSNSFYNEKVVEIKESYNKISLSLVNNPDIVVCLDNPSFLNPGYIFEPSHTSPTLNFDLMLQKSYWVYFLILMWLAYYLVLTKTLTLTTRYCLYLVAYLVFEPKSLRLPITYFNACLKSLLLTSLTSLTVWVFYFFLYTLSRRLGYTFLFGDFCIKTFLNLLSGQKITLNIQRVCSYSLVEESVGSTWILGLPKNLKFWTQVPVKLGISFYNENTLWKTYWIPR